MRCLVVSTYELGRQPFGVASAAAWLGEAGVTVDCLDLAVEALDETKVAGADLIAFHVPMHTATRIALARLPAVQRVNADAHICFFGLYAPVNEPYLRRVGVGTVLGGEFEEGLVSLARRLLADRHAPGQVEPVISLARQEFRVPERTALPPLHRYARLNLSDGRQRVVGYTEASRGCKHVCRHCPVVPVYGGRFRVVQRDVVLADVARQVDLGAEHITFGDPDFLNGPAHAAALVRALHERFPRLSYDVTIKIEHLRQRPELLELLRDTGCLFVTSAVEAVDDATLTVYDKNHTRQDFIDVALAFRLVGLVFNPTFVTFSPWTTLESYADLLVLLAELELVDHVAPIQLAIRLLVPAGSRLLELPETRELVGAFDDEMLCYPWQHPQPMVDVLYEAVRDRVAAGTDRGADRREIFAEVWSLARDALDEAGSAFGMPREPELGTARSVPTVSEPWYCCAEPTEALLRGAGNGSATL
ncbi:MAG TPA: CUAEP/CCAEP-tail radical SAM protein [Planosporangium sp.]|nr:CUAEP/CCAEP-tail radical SAM protein [Planosporangium sp.]